jgi:hypothetical protein
MSKKITNLDELSESVDEFFMVHGRVPSKIRISEELYQILILEMMRKGMIKYSSPMSPDSFIHYFNPGLIEITCL